MNNQNSSAKEPLLSKSQLRLLRWLLIPLFFVIYVIYVKYVPRGTVHELSMEIEGREVAVYWSKWDNVGANIIPISVVTLAFCLAQFWVQRALDNKDTTQP